MNEVLNEALNKGSWGAGPWLREPDKANWIDKDTDYDCMVVRGPGGHWCGYVGLPSSHPLYKKEYSEEELYNIEAHGGLTYSDMNKLTKKLIDKGMNLGLLPDEIREYETWWLGFDCAHLGDLCPGHEAMLSGYGASFSDCHNTYRTYEYVVDEVTALAKQLKKYEDAS